MRIFKFLFISLFFSCCFSEFVYSQKFIHRMGQTIVDSAGKSAALRGVNLSGWLEWEAWIWGTNGWWPGGFMSETAMTKKLTQLVGNTNTQLFRQQVYAKYIDENDIKSISQSCFNSVRINLNHIFLEDDSLPFFYKQSGWALLDTVINRCERNKLYVVLDFHSVPGGQSPYFIADPDSGGKILWDVESNKLRTIALWKAVAGRYKDRTIIAGYDLLNEPAPPAGDSLVNLYKRIIQAIRTVDPNHMMIVEGGNSAYDFSMFTLPLMDNNMTYSFHFYNWFGANEQIEMNKFKTFIEANDVPMWCGEWGENSYGKLDTARFTMDDPAYKISGWCFFTWKQDSSGSSYPDLNRFVSTTLWKKVIAWMEDAPFAPQPTYAEAMQAMSQFIGSVDMNNCTGDAQVQAIVNPCSGTPVFENSAKGIDAVIFPNPARDVIRCDFVASREEPLNIVVYDVIGNIVLSEKVRAKRGENNFILDISGLSGEFYFLRINGEKTKSQFKFVKQ